MRTPQSDYAHLNREELLQKVEQLQVEVDQYEYMKLNRTTPMNIFIKIGLEDAYRMQAALRNLVAKADESDDMLDEGDLYYAMYLLSAITPSFEDMHEFTRFYFKHSLTTKSIQS